MRWVILFFVALFMGGFWSSGAFAYEAIPGSAQCVPERDKSGKIKRSSYQVRKFRATHPCPSTGLTTGTCTGYVVDHAWPRCACGQDRPFNMMWQDKKAALAKDLWERELCKGLADD